MDKLIERFLDQLRNSKNMHTETVKEVKKPKKNGTIFAFIMTVLLFVVFEYLFLVPLNIKEPEFLITIAFFAFIFTALNTIFTFSFKKLSKFTLSIGILIMVIVIGGEFFSSAIFNASSYQQLLTVDKKADFYKDNEKVNYQSIPVVDKDSAQRLGDRKMGQIVDYVSQFEVDDQYDQINYKNKPYRVTTISYSDLIKWFTNHSEGLPAYISVDMVTQESEVVRLKEGMKYSKSDLFFRNINRHLRMNYPTKMYMDPSFEIDEQGHPYWIAPVYDYKIGLFGGTDIVGAILVDAINGDCQYYDIKDVPQWLDRIYPADIVLNQLEYWGAYTRGYFNTIFSQKGVLQPTDGYNYVALNDDVYIYTGLTSVSSDASNVGFALINLRTKEAKYYSISGAEEYSAMSSAEGKVQNLKYSATFPILINAGGQPTYFLSLKDAAGLVKMYAFVSVENYQIVATGASVAEAEKSYYQLLSDNGKTKIDTDDISVSAKVKDIQTAIKNGNSYYYFKLEGYKQVFIAPISLNDELPFMKVGDTVTIEYLEDNSQVETVSSIQIQ